MVPLGWLAIIGFIVIVACSGRAEDLYSGFGRANLPRRGPQGGYGGLFDRKAEGVSEFAPEANAIVLVRPGLRIAIVSLDIVIARPIFNELLEPTKRALGLDAIIVVATHSHSGPGGYIPGFLAEKVTSGTFDPRMPALMAEAAEKAIRLAVADLAPTRVAGVETSLDLARNRRHADGRNETVLPILYFDRGEYAPILLFSYGAHPTVLSAENRLYASDYPGVARAYLEAAGQRAMFLPGALGDQAPGEESLGDLCLEKQWKLVHEVGETLGSAVLAAEATLPPAQDVIMNASVLPVETWPMDIRDGSLLWFLTPIFGGQMREFLSDSVLFYAIHIGHAWIVTVPAEPTSEVVEGIRARLPQASTRIVVVHASDWVGYVPTEHQYERGGYEPNMSFFGPKVSRWLVDAAVGAVQILEEAEDRDSYPRSSSGPRLDPISSRPRPRFPILNQGQSVPILGTG